MIHINSTVKYLKFINKFLNLKTKKNNLTVCDLFAGTGGLSLGFEARGFKTVGFEYKNYASDTYNKNLKGKCYNQKLDLNTIYPKCDVLIGGPPCQPFSVSGNQKGKFDKRDGFPIFLEALTQIKPKVFLIENVRGSLFRNKKYLQAISKSLESKGYIVCLKIIKADLFAIPQKRERLFILGSKKPLIFPSRLLIEPISSGIAIGDLLNKNSKNYKFLTRNMDIYILRYEKKSKCINPRDLILTQPARTLTCRNLGGQTADMMRIKKGTRRRFLTVREAARLQSFPDWFTFLGTDYQKMEQIGNAVPPFLAYVFADVINNYLTNTKMALNSYCKFEDQQEFNFYKKVV